jgi:hypothetical protein
MALEDILGTRHYRRSFYMLFVLLVILLILIRYVALPQIDASLKLGWSAFAADLSDRILASLIVTVAIGTFIFWLRPDILTFAKIEVVEPRSIGPLLRDAMTKTDLWWFKGASGRYLRAQTLPSIAVHARESGVSKEIIALLIDPANDRLCEQYATYRRSLRSASQDKQWTSLRVKKEVYATILAVIRHQHDEPLLRISLALTNHFSSFRIDLSSPYAIITREDALAPAVKCDKGTYYYDSYADDILLSQQQARRLAQPTTIPSFTAQSADLVRTMLKDLGLPAEDLNDTDLINIIAASGDRKNPYA